MGEIRQFPNQYERLIRLGKAALNQRDWQQASTCFEAAYQLDQTMTANLLWVSALIEARDNQTALAIVEEQQDAYLQQTDLAQFYLALLLNNHHFITANQILVVLNHAKIAPEMIKMFRLMITTAELAYQTNYQTTIQKKAQRLYNLTAYPLSEQLTLLNQAQQLPRNDYVDSVMPILTNPYSHAFVKTTVIETLVQLNLNQTVQVSWFDQEKSFVPAQSHLMGDSVLFNAVLQALNTQLAAEDPILLAQVTADIEMGFAYLYPFEAEIMYNPMEWAQAWLKQLLGSDYKPTIVISEKIQDWVEKLQKKTEKLDF
ncbi:hypothetical protein [Latilactobacillus graminis]|uniref:TPR repeat-containing protein n=2 Tax=Latilactobacillus graminis TaxID=60519 RepID=A0AA89I1G9_9LACO|nr:hypothetical protein [Latilactobacillus graminis]KRM23831.1 hypothetical protein FC90_GL001351 [Latilactobacillus graminis DSM 20719]QFP79721.1 hypothetical protein LG542_05465 [Latilactobacillus graminis]